MASRASSEPGEPAKLPFLGTSWYGRGAGYWARRITLAGFLLVGLLLLGLFVTGVYLRIVAGLSPTLRLVCHGAQILACCAFLVWGWKSARKQIQERRLNPPAPKEAWQRQREESRRGASLAIVGRVIALFAMPVLPAVMAYLLGMVCAGAFARELPMEIGARRALEQERSGADKVSRR